MSEINNKKEAFDQLNFRISAKLHQEFKVEAVKKGVTVSSAIREFMAKYVADARKSVVY